jgi:hypothetical protein
MEAAPVDVQLQKPKENTCVACSVVNVLRHFDQDVPVDVAIEAMFVKRLGPKGSFTTKAAKWLTKEHGMIAECSRPPHLITDPLEAAREAVTRWQALLAKGWIGILHHKVTPSAGHAVVLFDIVQSGDDWELWTYDSAARSTGGLNSYSAIDFLWLQPNKKKIRMAEATPAIIELLGIKPTGRTAWFFKPFAPLRLNLN